MRRPILPLLFLLCLAVLIAHYSGFPLRPEGSLCKAAGSVATVDGTVTSVQVKDGYYALIVRLPRKGLFPEKCLMRASLDIGAEEAFSLMGRKVAGTGRISLPDAARNPGAFNYRLYLKARNISSICKVSKYKFAYCETENFFLHAVGLCKGWLFGNLQANMDAEDFSMAVGILFGEKGYMDSSLYKEFRENGIAHVLAVSGLHINFVYDLVEKLLGGKKRLINSAAGIIVLFFYAALSNFSFSALRAFCMIILRLIAFHTEKEYDIVNAASVTAVIFIIFNPYIIFDSGTQLSFLCVYSVGVVLPWLKVKLLGFADRHRWNWPEWVFDVLGANLAVQMGMLPLMAYQFLMITPLALLINPVAVALAGAIVPLGIIAAVFPGSLTGRSAGALCRLLRLCSGRAAGLWGAVSVPALPLGLLCLYYGWFFYFFSEARYILHRKGLAGTAENLGAVIVLAASLIPYNLGVCNSPFPWKYNKWEAVFLDVGQGDSLHINNNGFNVLVDGGGSLYSDIAENTLKPYLLKNGIADIDLAIVTHLDADHCLGIKQLSGIMKIKTIAFPISCKNEDLSDFVCESKVFLKAGDVITVGSGELRVLWPLAESSGGDDNSNSLVCSYVSDGRSYLLTADIDEDTERELLAKYDLSSDCLKVAHHGSRYSSSEDFIAEVSPGMAVISVGANNNYGHPSDRVIELLEKSGIIIRRTDLEGAICINPQK